MVSVFLTNNANVCVGSPDGLEYWKNYNGPLRLSMLSFIWNYSIYLPGGNPIKEERYEEWVATLTWQKADNLLWKIRATCTR